MKKYKLFILLFFLINKLTSAQTPITPAITIHGSYVTAGDALVSPYNESTNGPDPTIHFRIKKGEKFTLEDQVKDKSNNIIGYLIKVWEYPDDSAKTHSKYFKDLLSNFYAGKTKSLLDISSLSEKLTRINTMVSDSLNIENNIVKIKEELKINNDLLLNFKNKLIQKALSLNMPQKKFPDFVNTQKKLKLEYNSPLLQDNLIEAIKNLPSITDPEFINSRMNYFNYKNTSDTLNKHLMEYTTVLDQRKVALSSLRTEFQNEKIHVIKAQIDPGSTIDPEKYKKTKSQALEKFQSPDPNSPFAPFANLEYVDMWANDAMLFMSATDFSKNATPIYPKSFTFTWGFLTLPVKMRFPNNNPGGIFNFEQNLNFGLTVGFKQQLVRKSDVSWNYLAGLSVVNVPLNDASASTPATSTAAISISGGIMFQFEKFQIGAFSGFDYAGDHAGQFLYQGKPWLGIAIGLSLFGETKTTATPQTNNAK